MLMVSPVLERGAKRDKHVGASGVRRVSDLWQLAMPVAAIVYAVTQPPHVNVNEILIRPTQQER